MKTVVLPVLTCLRPKCRYSWIPRKSGRPVECPKCKRRDWDKKKEG